MELYPPQYFFLDEPLSVLQVTIQWCFVAVIVHMWRWYLWLWVWLQRLPRQPFPYWEVAHTVHPCCFIGPSYLATVYFLYFHRRNYLVRMPSWSDSNIFLQPFQALLCFLKFPNVFLKSCDSLYKVIMRILNRKLGTSKNTTMRPNKKCKYTCLVCWTSSFHQKYA